MLKGDTGLFLQGLYKQIQWFLSVPMNLLFFRLRGSFKIIHNRWVWYCQTVISALKVKKKKSILSLHEKRDSGKVVLVSTILLPRRCGFFTFWVTNKFPFKWLECRGGERKRTPLHFPCLTRSPSVRTTP